MIRRAHWKSAVVADQWGVVLRVTSQPGSDEWLQAIEAAVAIEALDETRYDPAHADPLGVFLVQA